MTSTDQLACSAKATTAPSFAAIRSRILADESLSEERRREMASALSTLAKALSKPAEMIPADALALRALMKGRTAAMVGLKTGRWQNVLSLVGAALGHCRIIVVQGRIREAPAPAWMTVLGLLPKNAGLRFNLSRFARYCTLIQVMPDAVSDAVLARYETDSTERSLAVEPQRSARDVARLWNKVADANATWPQQRLSVPDNRNHYSPGWETYPQSLVRDANAWCEGLGESDPFADRPFRPLKATSVTSRHKLLKLYLGALVLEGVDPATMVDLASVVTPARARIALKFFWDRADKKATTYVHGISHMVLMIARHWAHLPEVDLKCLYAMNKQLRPTVSGMTQDNVALLRQFDDPKKQQALLELPATLLAGAKMLGQQTVQAALLAQTAAIIELLLHIPMRIKNLCNLRIGTHVIRGPQGAMHIALPAAEVKNEVAINATLGRETARLIGEYIDRYRPLLTKGEDDYLWPGQRAGTPKTDVGLRTQIQDVVADRVGARINPHTFRHLAAYMMLGHDPGCHGAVQRVLGHKSYHSTKTFYSGLETPAALAGYDDLIARQRGDARPVEKPRRRRGFR